MKILKRVMFVLLAIIALLVLVALFLPSKVHVERSISIVAPAEVVFEQVNTLKNWEYWSPWHDRDPEMALYYEGPESGEGARYLWESDHPNVGNGELTILESVPYQLIVTELNFMEQGMALSTYTFTDDDMGTTLTWSMDADMGWNPVSRYFGLFMDRFIGPDFEHGLANIKMLIEEQ
jgi:uncharacterized protein YndB with AHSA1/START domain